MLKLNTWLCNTVFGGLDLCMDNDYCYVVHIYSALGTSSPGGMCTVTATLK